MNIETHRQADRIDLVFIGDGLPEPEWRLGKRWGVDRHPSAVSDLVHSRILTDQPEAILFWSNRAGPLPKPDVLASCLGRPSQVSHYGLGLGMAGQPSFIDFVAPTWMLNRDPSPHIEASSWRLSLDAALIEAEVLRSMGGFDAGYESVEAMGLDFGYRCIMAGVLITNVPSLVDTTSSGDALAIPPKDQVRFIRHGWGTSWMGWACLRSLATAHPGCMKAVMAGRASMLGPTPSARAEPRDALLESRPAVSWSGEKVSVVLPTLGRYPYLRKVLSDLSRQTVAPDEVIVVDGNAERETDWIDSFTSAPMKVLTQTKPGQCTARNLGIEAASGDWILFIDDDDELPADLIERHLKWAKQMRADVSCGVVDEVGAVPRDPAYKIKRISDGFPTDNMLAKRDSVTDAGCFDERLDRGEREDHDLGMRIYLRGGLLMQNPTITVLHHHAPEGGLRAHGSRINTYGASRRRLMVRRLPTPSDIYIERKYHTERQMTESKWLALLGTARLHGSLPRKLLKVALALVLLPQSISRVKKAEADALRMASDESAGAEWER